MRRNWYFVSIFILCAVSLHAQDTLTNQLSVSGHWKAQVPAEYAQISLMVEGFGSQLGEAVQTARSNVRQVQHHLQELGISDEQIETNKFVSGENYFDKSFLSSKRDYRTNIGLRVTVDSIDQLDPVLLALHDQAVATISNVQFFLRQPDYHKRLTLAKAAQIAHAKAQILADTFHMMLGAPVLIEEQQTAASNQLFESYVGVVAERSRGARPLPSHLITVEASVNIRYHIRSIRSKVEDTPE